MKAASVASCPLLFYTISLPPPLVTSLIADCAAREYSSLVSREFKRSARSRGILDLFVHKINDHSLYYLTTRDLGIPIPGFAEREFRSKATWHKNERGEVILDFADAGSDCDNMHPVKPRSVVANQHTIYFFEPLPPIGDVPQTRVVMTTKMDLNGSIPSYIMYGWSEATAEASHRLPIPLTPTYLLLVALLLARNTLAPKFVSVLSRMRQKFDRSKEVDAFNRQRVADKLRTLEVGSTFHGPSELQSGLQRVRGRDSTMMHVRRTALGRGEGRVTANIRVGLEEAAAFFWDFASRENFALSGDVSRSVEVVKTDVLTTRKSEKNTHGQREFESVMKLFKPDIDSFVIQTEPVTTEGRRRSLALRSSPRGHKFGFGQEWAILRLKRRGERYAQRLEAKRRQEQHTAPIRVRVTLRKILSSPTCCHKPNNVLLIASLIAGEMETEAELVTEVNLGKHASRATTRASLLSRLDILTRTSFYFNGMVSSSDMTAAEGKTMGEALMFMAKEKTKNKDDVVKVFVESTKPLGELTARYAFIKSMMCAVLENKLTSLAKMNQKADVLNEREGGLIGRSLAISLATTLTPVGGVDEWIHQVRKGIQQPNCER